MKRLIICDKRTDFLHDLAMRVILDEKDLVITKINSAEKFLAADMAANQMIIISENLLEELPAEFEKQLPPEKVMGYCTSFNGKKLFQERGISCLGIVANSNQLLTMLASMPDNRIEYAGLPPQTRPPTPKEEPSRGDDFSAWKHQSLRTESGNETSNITLGSAPDIGEQPDIVKSILKKREERVRNEADRLLETDVAADAEEQTTTTVTVCSTKGGVGKTTVSTQLASCLALTSHGRGRFRTCVADFDINFGDICTMLDFDPHGPTMVEWAKDVRKRIQSGENPESIQYARGEIERYLQHKKDTGLFALIAPVRHMDSMDIGPSELTVMLQNLVDNAGMDFVVLDTGNDTRDATVIALDKADHILLVATQDVACAHCLDLFLKTMEAVRFDMGKFKLVINNVMSAKETGIAVSELKESFPYPCWATIKHDPAIIRSNNYGRPVVFSATHDMTKQMRQIVSLLNSGGTITASKPKSSFFKDLFGRKE